MQLSSWTRRCYNSILDLDHTLTGTLSRYCVASHKPTRVNVPEGQTRLSMGIEARSRVRVRVRVWVRFSFLRFPFCGGRHPLTSPLMANPL